MEYLLNVECEVPLKRLVEIFIKHKKGILWMLLIANMIAIFALSSQPADVSTEETDFLLKLPKGLFNALHPELADDFDILVIFRQTLRKIAHLMEFATLSVWAIGLLMVYNREHPYRYGVLFAIAYAASDEFHQEFIPGRTGKITDLCIDAAGALLGAWIVMKVLQRYKMLHRLGEPLK